MGECFYIEGVAGGSHRWRYFSQLIYFIKYDAYYDGLIADCTMCLLFSIILIVQCAIKPLTREHWIIVVVTLT